MPTKGARLIWRERPGRPGDFAIRDTGVEISTGTGDRRQAEIQLAELIARKNRANGPVAADQMTVGDALTIYGEEHAQPWMHPSA